MKTEISRFCTVCSDSLGSLPSVLTAAADECERAGGALQKPLATLNDARARLRSLTEKLRSQQAYLLIFGPLKSGKSTLMNAISRTYVSEVTSLPGYPCLVFVQHEKEPRFSVTRYNGRESVYPSAAILNDAVADAHHALAQQIRMHEQRGEAFDPRANFPEAIRRVDIKLPVESLADSSTVLVDTPGLYSRMNFGYDVLTREFRDSAACAVFVVKTDNLFLEQVFAEFNELLGLFSRIFIVVNVDASKRDLGADGTLYPSAESHHPEKILEAFTTLSMAGPMRAAYQSGRVRLHAVDLLGAAAEFISGAPTENTHRPAFDAFIQDLTDYLNSSDYTREFVRDSLRQASALCEEARSTADGPEIQQLREIQDRLGKEMRDLDARLAATDRLLRVDWTALFQAFQAEHASAGEDDSKRAVAQAREDLRLGLNRWYLSNDSLSALTHLHWNPVLTDAARALAEQSKERLHRLASRAHAGLHPTVEVLADLQTTGFSTNASSQKALTAANAEEDVASYKVTIPAESIPVRKSVLDWLLFRSVANVRRRIFGEDLAKEIPADVKAKRLGAESRAELERLIETTLQARFPSKPSKHGADLVSAFLKRVVEEIVSSLRQSRDQIAQQRNSRQVPFDRQARIITAMTELESVSERVGKDIALLAEQESSLLADSKEETKSAEPSDTVAFVPQLLPPLLVG